MFFRSHAACCLLSQCACKLCQLKHDTGTESCAHVGINLPYYLPGQVEELVLLDLSPGMLSQARQKAVTAPTTFVQGDVQQLPFPESSFNTVVDTFSFCVYPDPEHAAQEMVRVLAPGETLLFRQYLQQASQNVHSSAVLFC